VETRTKPVIGLTGGIASGKSSVARELIALGIPVIDADQLAREVVEPGTEGLQEIVRTFGTAMLRADGTLDREKLGAHVFNDAEARKRLVAITHPRIGQLSAERIAAALQTDAPYVVYEAPLLVETGAYRGMSALIVVATAPEVQRARLMARENLDEAAARARIAAQAPLEAKLAVADYVLHNDAGLAELKAQVQQTHTAICQRFAHTTDTTAPDRLS